MACQSQNIPYSISPTSIRNNVYMAEHIGSLKETTLPVRVLIALHFLVRLEVSASVKVKGYGRAHAAPMVHLRAFAEVTDRFRRRVLRPRCGRS
jgi:hypothetical protein